ncbi:MAG: c-type cytochrome, partial [Acetobacteraceae bacterium]
VGPGQAAIFDLSIPDVGKYAFVDHDLAHLMIGAHGVLDVTATGAPSPRTPVTAGASAPSPAIAAPAAAPTGPYVYDAAEGASLYASNCSACHQATGTGLPGAFPPLKDNPVVQDPDPSKQIETILKGLHGENVMGTVYPTAMPPFGNVLNDAQIADIINHERTSWGNHGKPVTADAVKAARAK